MTHPFGVLLSSASSSVSDDLVTPTFDTATAAGAHAASIRQVQPGIRSWVLTRDPDGIWRDSHGRIDVDILRAEQDPTE